MHWRPQMTRKTASQDHQQNPMRTMIRTINYWELLLPVVLQHLTHLTLTSGRDVKQVCPNAFEISNVAATKYR